MKLHSEPKGWRFLPYYNLVNDPRLMDQLKNHPDVQESKDYIGFWIRPTSPLYTLLLLANAWPYSSTGTNYFGGGAQVLGIPRDQLTGNRSSE
jgi:hypothetical protein